MDALREAGALTLSLVAESAWGVVGHTAVSPVIVAHPDGGWLGMGPISVVFAGVNGRALLCLHP
ncbi:MAG: hypothetical protein M5U12_32580 [Verrucomicrobia bacterium]|nr:hypothetical protein [Verrucomicrobiota bacterium]